MNDKTSSTASGPLPPAHEVPSAPIDGTGVGVGQPAVAIGVGTQAPIDGTDGGQAPTADPGAQGGNPGLPFHGSPDVPAQALQVRPGKKSHALTALIIDEALGRPVECRRLHPRTTIERELEPGQTLIIRPTDDEEHAELIAEIAGVTVEPPKDPAG